MTGIWLIWTTGMKRLRKSSQQGGGVGELCLESIAVLKFIRDHYKAYSFFPIVHSICPRLHEPKNCIAEKFPNPLVAWKIAGLPHPEEPVISLLEAGQSPG